MDALSGAGQAGHVEVELQVNTRSSKDISMCADSLKNLKKEFNARQRSWRALMEVNKESEPDDVAEGNAEKIEQCKVREGSSCAATSSRPRRFMSFESRTGSGVGGYAFVGCQHGGCPVWWAL